MSVTCHPECPICFEAIDGGAVKTKCGHTFCFDCFMEHFSADKSNSNNCPLCRGELVKNKPKTGGTVMGIQVPSMPSEKSHLGKSSSRSKSDRPKRLPDPVINETNFIQVMLKHHGPEKIDWNYLDRSGLLVGMN